jgi:hypothetical protein
MSDLNRENGRDLTTNESTKSQLGAWIPRRRPQIAMRRGLESSLVSGRERNKEWNCFGEREREAWVGFEDRGYRSDRSFLTDRKTVQNGLPLP